MYEVNTYTPLYELSIACSGAIQWILSEIIWSIFTRIGEMKWFLFVGLNLAVICDDLDWVCIVFQIFGWKFDSQKVVVVWMMFNINLSLVCTLFKGNTWLIFEYPFSSCSLYKDLQDNRVPNPGFYQNFIMHLGFNRKLAVRWQKDKEW